MALFNYECDEVKRIIEEVSPNYPQLTTYEKEWLYFHKYGYIPGIPVELEYETVYVNPSGTVQNAIPYQYKSAILKGHTDENLQSVKMPVLTTSNEDGTKTNILTVNEEVELRGIGDVQDTLDLITGELTERVGEVVLDGSENWGYESAFHRGYTQVSDLIKSNDYRGKIICGGDYNILNNYGYMTDNNNPSLSGYNDISNAYPNNNWIYVAVPNITSLEGLKQYFTENPLTIQYQLATESVKTVDLTTLNKPYEGVNNYQLTANIPCEAILEVPVVSTGKQTLKEIND